MTATASSHRYLWDRLNRGSVRIGIYIYICTPVVEGKKTDRRHFPQNCVRRGRKFEYVAFVCSFFSLLFVLVLFPVNKVE